MSDLMYYVVFFFVSVLDKNSSAPHSPRKQQARIDINTQAKLNGPGAITKSNEQSGGAQSVRELKKKDAIIRLKQ